MKPTKYPGNGRGLYVEHIRSREGPPSRFNILYKDSARTVVEPIEISRVLGSARYTDQSKELRAWAEELHEKYGKKEAPELDMDQVKKEGFGPEAHGDTTDDDPTANTKMIT